MNGKNGAGDQKKEYQAVKEMVRETSKHVEKFLKDKEKFERSRRADSFK